MLIATSSDGETMRLLLASAGITNPSIRGALDGLLGKPVGECAALAIPTAGYANAGGMGRAWNFIAGKEPRCPMTELGWKSVGVLELTTLPSLGRERWLPEVEAADVLLVNGGDALYLAHWMRESGLADVLPSLDVVWVGLSAGSMVMTPRIGQEFVGWTPPSGDDRTLGLVDFSIFPHLDHPDLTENTLAAAEQWGAALGNRAYAIDDQTAILVNAGAVDVVSEGHWRLFEP
jgi:dipeptidase E